MKYTRIPENTFQQLQMNAGILAKTFDPKTGEVDGLLGATSGGITFSDSMSFKDLGEDIDNCPKNMLELKQLESHEVTASGTFVTVSADLGSRLAAVADIDPDDSTHIVPRNDLLKTDFSDVWFIGDYSDVNTGDDAGFLAIHIMNALNTGGFQIKSSDKAKGQFAFTFMGHYSMEDQDKVPYEIFIKEGAEPGDEPVVVPSVTLSESSVNITVGANETLEATVVPESAEVTWSTDDEDGTYITVLNGIVHGVSAGSANVTASITVDGKTYSDTCAVTVGGV